jgi:hypothetical protein
MADKSKIEWNDLSDIQVSLDERKRAIARLRRQARARHGRDKRNWPIDVLSHVQLLIELCREDERSIRECNEHPYRTRPLLVVDNGKGMGR